MWKQANLKQKQAEGLSRHYAKVAIQMSRKPREGFSASLGLRGTAAPILGRTRRIKTGDWNWQDYVMIFFIK